VKWLLELGRISGAKLKGNYAEAAERYRQAVLAGRSAGVSEERTAEVEREWGMTEAGMGHAEEAERLVSEADDAIRRSMGDEHPRRIRFLMARGFTAELRGDNRAAYEYDMQAIQLGERVAPDHSSLAPAYNNACTNLYYLGDARGALPLCEKSIEICLRHYGAENLRMVHAVLSAGHALVALNRYDEGIARYKSILAFEQKNGATRQIYFIEARAGLGRALLLSGKPKEAIASLEQALVLRRESDAASIHIERVDGEARFALAQALWQIGTRTARVASLAQEALAIDRRIHRDDEATRIERWLEAHPAP
jgi:tetratricopeptide (TPR) repeat protein